MAAAPATNTATARLTAPHRIVIIEIKVIEPCLLRIAVPFNALGARGRFSLYPTLRPYAQHLN